MHSQITHNQPKGKLHQPNSFTKSISLNSYVHKLNYTLYNYMLYHIYKCINLEISIITCSETFTGVKGKKINKSQEEFIFSFKIRSMGTNHNQGDTMVIPFSFEYHRTVNPTSGIHISYFYLRDFMYKMQNCICRTR